MITSPRYNSEHTLLDITKLPYNAARRLALGLDINHLFGELRQLLIGCTFFIKRLLEQLLILVIAELVRVCPHATIASDLVMLHALRCGNQASIYRGRLAFHFAHLVAFAEQPLHTFADWAFGIFAELLENLLKPLDVAFGLRQMLLERALELRVRGGLCHAGKCLYQLRFGAVEIVELLHIQVA